MKTGKSWTENADEIIRLRAVNAELATALYQALGRIEALDPDPGIVTRQIYDHGQALLAGIARAALAKAVRS